ncbi:MAG: tRNA pseudouridine(55) synthase TruB [Clostridiales bacterium]|nr:tRNA pseudouridine(55) synthase TruB [Clostridiales bacterium]
MSGQSDNRLSGVLNIYKEKGYTSSDVVSVVRKILGRVKAGHTGTLDPDAEGVLPVCVGKATKIADYIGGGKSYRAGLRLGVTTDTDDLTGKILTENHVVTDLITLKNAASQFLGETFQIPPMYSAIKVGGKKLYELARAGKTADRAPRKVSISRIDIVEYNPETFTAVMDVDCSKGTYIRSLCADIGRALGRGGCMSSLIRTRSGPFRLSASVTLDQLREYAAENRVNEILTPIETVLPYKTIEAPLYLEKSVINGNPIRVSVCENGSGASEDDLIFLTLGGNTAGVYQRAGEFFKPRVMLTGE